MHRFSAIIIAGLLACNFGCCSIAPDGEVFHSFGWDNAREAKFQLGFYKQILVVCISEDHWEDRSPPKYSLHHFKGTVVKTYKGDWNAAEQIAFVSALDSPAPVVASNTFAGNLVAVFANEHKVEEIGLEPGERLKYDSNLKHVLDYIYKQ
jgi:hypothetical protein